MLLLVLTGCSALRIGYDNGPALLRWWLDGYLDLTATQEAQLRPEIADWFAWHRSTQLPDYAAALAEMRERATGPVSADDVCGWTQAWRARLRLAAERLLPAAAQLLPGISDAQWRRMAQQQAQKNAELRQEFLADDTAERAAASLRRTVERAETMYGELDEQQRALLAQGLAESPFDPVRWLTEREARQRAALRSLKAIQNTGADGRRKALHELLDASLQSPDPAYRAYQARLIESNCRLAAQLHNTTSPRQREHLSDKLAGWESDLRALAGSAPPPDVQ